MVYGDPWPKVLCKPWNIDRRQNLVHATARRKIPVMAAQFERDDERPEPGTTVDEDAAALAELARSVALGRPIEPAEQLALLERAALGDRTSEERLVATNLPMVIRLAGSRKDQGLSAADLVQEGSIGLVEAVRPFTAGGATDVGPFTAEREAMPTGAAITSAAGSR